MELIANFRYVLPKALKHTNIGELQVSAHVEKDTFKTLKEHFYLKTPPGRDGAHLLEIVLEEVRRF